MGVGDPEPSSIFLKEDELNLFPYLIHSTLSRLSGLTKERVLELTAYALEHEAMHMEQAHKAGLRYLPGIKIKRNVQGGIIIQPSIMLTGRCTIAQLREISAAPADPGDVDKLI